MTDFNSNEKIIQLLLENLFPISSSVNTLLDNLIKILNDEFSDTEISNMNTVVLTSLEGTIAHLVTLDKEVPIKEAKDSNDELLLMYHSAMKHILEGLKIVLEWLHSQEDNKDKIRLAIDNLFEGAQLTVNLVNKIL